ncbi:MAG: TIGR03936 family radical SAM-associated protein, partial [Chloroflexota bacterium]
MPDPTDPAAGPPAEPPAAPPPEPRQRWRLVVARDAGAPPLAQRELTEAWEAAITAAGLPVARTGDARARARISFGAPLPIGIAAEADLIDLVITERWPAWRVREALIPLLPERWRLVDVHDVWLAGPALAGRVAAADYRVVVEGPGAADPGALAETCATLLASRRVPRERLKGGAAVTYDLRPLVLDARVADDRPPVVLRIRTRFHPEFGSGRPEEVVGALGDIGGRPLEARSIVRERLVLAEDLAEDLA